MGLISEMEAIDREAFRLNSRNGSLCKAIAALASMPFGRLLECRPMALLSNVEFAVRFQRPLLALVRR